MARTLLAEEFNKSQLDRLLTWFCPPRKWSIDASRGVLTIEPDADTDFWQTTHYGFQVDNGHFLFARIRTDFVVTTRVRFRPVNQYDQAGLMVRISPSCWLKTSVEYEPDGPAQLGAVATNGGYSDWSTQPFSWGSNELWFRIRREGTDYVVEVAPTSRSTETAEAWTTIRVTHLHEDRPGGTVECGLYACSPKGAGFVAEFDSLTITEGDDDQ